MLSTFEAENKKNVSTSEAENGKNLSTFEAENEKNLSTPRLSSKKGVLIKKISVFYLGKKFTNTWSISSFTDKQGRIHDHISRER